MYSIILQSTFIAIPCLIMVAFVTLMERKILGMMQYRKGPNKVSLWGILQPIADALKLFFKETTHPVFGNKMLFLISPFLSLALILTIWMLAPLSETFIWSKYSLFFILMLLSFGVYPLLLSGWSSNNKYSLWGSTRGVAQTISYEINLTLVIFGFALFFSAFKLFSVLQWNAHSWLMFSSPILSVLLLLICIMETNRTPFDFAEGESELVSGFNTEYSSGLFALIFLAEYASILFFSLLWVTLAYFTSCSSMFSFMLMAAVSFIWIWVRATFPRYRYDLLMNMAWKTMLPSLLSLVFFYLILFLIK